MSAKAATTIRLRIDARLDAADLPPAAWRATAARGDTWTVFQEWHWLDSWWRSYGRGELLLVSAWSGSELQALAPMFVDGRMAFLVGSGGSDYLDFIGDVSPPGTLEMMLEAVLRHCPDLLGLRFYHLPDDSRSGALLRGAAQRLGLDCVDEGAIGAHALALGTQGDAADAAARKRSLLRHERVLRRGSVLQVRHLTASRDILPRLDAFFAQHRSRWAPTGHPSLFNDPLHCAFYRRLAMCADACGWLRFTALERDGATVAAHFGFLHRGRYLWYKPSFDIALARYSPGEVLLRQLLLDARDQQAQVFDFGIGDEAFKQRFANRHQPVRTWGVYPRQ